METWGSSIRGTKPLATEMLALAEENPCCKGKVNKRASAEPSAQLHYVGSSRYRKNSSSSLTRNTESRAARRTHGYFDSEKDLTLCPTIHRRVVSS